MPSLRDTWQKAKREALASAKRAKIVLPDMFGTEKLGPDLNKIEGMIEQIDDFEDAEERKDFIEGKVRPLAKKIGKTIDIYHARIEKAQAKSQDPKLDAILKDLDDSLTFEVKDELLRTLKTKAGKR